MSLDAFHPITRRWFESRFGQPTEPQRLGWPEILAGHDTLIAAPTGSGKTLAAFLASLDRLVREGLDGTLSAAVRVVYVSPLKALSNDIERNLNVPLAELQQTAAAMGLDLPDIRTALRTGDTPASQRQAMTRRPPHILVTTPESLYLILTSRNSREMLRQVDTVIVDEIHALARDKRGSHLALSLERLQHLSQRSLQRIGLSATQRPIDEIAGFLVGAARFTASDSNGVEPRCRVIDVGNRRELDLAVSVPPSELSAVCSHEQWDEIYGMLVEMIEQHRSTLVFVNTRRLAERVAHHLSERLGSDAVASHHGSLSRNLRMNAEARLKAGELKALVATASLELGIDIGYVDLVCQIGSPRSIATALQRIGRSGHALGQTPKGRLFPLSRDDLIESLALVRAIQSGQLDAIEIPPAPLDILAQQIVAAVACQPWDEDALYELVRRAWPYRNLRRDDFDAIVNMLSYGVVPGTRRGAYLHRDGVNRRLRARRNARLTAITCGGAIPDNADFRVVAGDERVFVGTVNEDFAIESLAGDVFLLGNSSWRIRYVRGGEVAVDDAEGAPATIPFWFGEAPGRTIELSTEVSDLREEIAEQLVAHSRADNVNNASRRRGTEHARDDHPIGRAANAANTGVDPYKGPTSTPTDPPTAQEADVASAAPTGNATDAAIDVTAGWLAAQCGCSPWAAMQAVRYVAAQREALGLVPTQRDIVFERFFDESGGMQLVIHAPLGSRINRAWGLAMRKRFCRSFNFELQAAADDNGIVLSLGAQHSFPLEQMFGMLHKGNAEHLLKQALLAAPMFQIRWRWNITRALAIRRQEAGKRVAPQLQRMRSDDLLSAVFPETTACLENHTGDIEIPDHPIVAQTIFDCLHEAMDLNRWLALIDDIGRQRVRLIARDTREPSPFCYGILNANPYAFLDDAPLEERRTRAVATRRQLPLDELTDLAAFDAAAIAQVRQEAWPLVRDAEELHDTLLMLIVLPENEADAWRPWFSSLVADGRAASLTIAGGPTLWFAAERWPFVRALYPDAARAVDLRLPPSLDRPIASTDALQETVRGHLACVGPTTAEEIGQRLALRSSAVFAALEALEGDGTAMRGRFSQSRADGSSSANVPAETGASPRPSGNRQATDVEWCDRRLLARIHRLTLAGARQRVRPVPVSVYIRMLLAWQHVDDKHRAAGRAGVLEVLGGLQGFEAPAVVWEQEILPARVSDYDPAWLDELTLSGEITWGRLMPPQGKSDGRFRGNGITRSMPISLVARSELSWLLPSQRAEVSITSLSSVAQATYEALREHGALFFDELVAATDLLPSYVERALGELAAQGLVSSDGFGMLRRLMASRTEGTSARRSRRKRQAARSGSYRRNGRWSRFPGPWKAAETNERLEQWARLLLRRYGIVFREVLTRESAAPSWRELRPVYQRLEARREVFGGRFVSGVGGEQFADRQAVTLLRRMRDESADNDRWVVISACDPANLVGIVSDEPRVPAVATHRLALRGGHLIAARLGDSTEFYEELDNAEQEAIRFALQVSGTVRCAMQAGRHVSPLVEQVASATTSTN